MTLEPWWRTWILQSGRYHIEQGLRGQTALVRRCIVIKNSLLQVPPHCIPIHANVTTYDWGPLVEACQFDVIMMDPPWQLATANPTRGVALGYSQLTDADIQALPIGRLQSNGFLFIWVINTKYHFTLDLLDRWGYRSAGRVSIRGMMESHAGCPRKCHCVSGNPCLSIANHRLVDEVVWVKLTVNRRLAKSHGFYLQHAKEVCLVAKKGADPPGLQHRVGSDVILR